jgi:hypothetical protein
MLPFMFATGIENSSPTIGNGRIRRDQMEECGHYRWWKTDFELVAQLGVHTLRYGVPLHRAWLAPDRYDWDFADLAFGELRRMAIEPSPRAIRGSACTHPSTRCTCAPSFPRCSAGGTNRCATSAPT